MSDLDRTIRFRVNLGRAIITETKSVNGQEPDSSGNIALNATHIPVSGEENAQSVAEALEAMQGMTAEDINYETPEEGQEAQTVKQVIDGIIDGLETDMTELELDAMFEDVFGGEE